MSRFRSVRLALLLSVAPCFASCAPDEPGKPDATPEPPGTTAPCDRLTLRRVTDEFGALETALPARVSVFFQVTCGTDPVAGLRPEDFRILEDGEPASVFESQSYIDPKPQDFRLYSLLLLDLSNSLVGDPESGIERLLQYVQSYVETVTDPSIRTDHYVAIAAFDGRPELQSISDFGTDSGEILDAVSSVECGTEFCRDSSTNLNGAVLSGVDALDGALTMAADDGVAFVESLLVVFTDGKERADYFPDDEMVLDRARSSAHEVITIGLGGEIDSSYLTRLGTGAFEYAEDMESLEDVFGRVSQRIVDLANSYYQFDYCSPSRSGQHELTLEATRDDVSGQLTAPFDATGFTFGCLPDPDACPAGMADCDADAVRCEADLMSTDATCGTCDTACSADEECVDAACIEACGNDEERCGVECVSLANTEAHCGSCGAACATGEVCVDGECTCSADATRCDDVCVNTDDDEMNCGACGYTCDAQGQTCEQGVCVCPADSTICSGVCADTSSSRFHCGACGNSCRNDQVCDGGTCACSDAGAMDCATGCLTCEGETPHCGVNGPNACCSDAYPRFCDVPGWGTGCFGNSNPNGDCNTVVRCDTGSWICSTGYEYNCATAQCEAL